jgi:hypothetical protein
LRDLDSVVLDPPRAARFAALEELCRGAAPWRLRKLAEARSLLSLEQIAPRLAVLDLDVRTEWRALVRLRCAVPCRPDGVGALVVVSEAALAIQWPEAALRMPLPGYAFVGVAHPRGLWHGNVSADLAQRLCLGPTLPPCTPVREIVIAAYGALTMQTVRLDPRDPAGVMNAEAARWWLEHADRVPLTDEPFLSALPDPPAPPDPAGPADAAEVEA